MFTRAPKSLDILLNGVQMRDVMGRENLYPTAFPFDRGTKNAPTSCVPVTLHGQASGVTTAQDCWPLATSKTFPTAGFTLGVSSSSASDVKTSGTGAWTVEVDILDTSYVPHTLTIDLNGNTKVSDTLYVGACLRVNDIRVVNVGTGLKNAGIVYAYDASDTVTAGVPQTATKIFSVVAVGDNFSRCASYTVPAGCEVQVNNIRTGFNEESVASSACIAVFRQSVLVGTKRITVDVPIAGQITNSSGALQIDLENPIIVREKTDVTVIVTASAATVPFVFADCVIYTKEA